MAAQSTGAGMATATVTLALALLATLPGAGSLSAQPHSGVTKLAEDFCSFSLAPDEEGLREILSASLAEMIEEAERRNAVIAAETPDEKPPFGDGIPYRSYPDRPDSCAPGATRETGEATEIEIVYGFAAHSDASWTDTLIVFGDPPRIVDIRFQGAPDGSVPQTLRDVLNGAFDF